MIYDHASITAAYKAVLPYAWVPFYGQYCAVQYHCNVRIAIFRLCLTSGKMAVDETHRSVVKYESEDQRPL